MRFFSPDDFRRAVEIGEAYSGHMLDEIASAANDKVELLIEERDLLRRAYNELKTAVEACGDGNMDDALTNAEARLAGGTKDWRNVTG